MKQKILFFLVLLLCFACMVTSCGEEKGAETYSVGLSFLNLPDGKCAVDGLGTCEDTEVKIPPTSPDGKIVVASEGYAFQDKTELTSVKLPATVTDIGAYAFAGCTSLVGMTLPDGVKTIGLYAFSRCEALKQIYLGSSLTRVEDGAFYGCKGLTYAFYRGGKSAWNRVQVGNGNSALTLSGVLYLYSATYPSDNGSYWYYRNGSIGIWS